MGEDIWKEETKERQSNMKTCPNCKAMHYNEVLVCKECGYSLPESRDTQKVKVKEPNCSELLEIRDKAQALIDDVRGRYDIKTADDFQCPLMQELFIALEKQGAKSKPE